MRLAAAVLLVVGVLSSGCQPSGPDGLEESTQASADADAKQQSPPATGSPSSAKADPRDWIVLSEKELAEGWISLFDGQTLYGWKPASATNWRVENGAIVADGGEKGLLCTTTRFADYVLQLDFRCPPETNSGVFLRTPVAPTDPAKDCYELNIAAPAVSPFSTGGFVQRKKAEGEFDTSDWRTFTVTAQGGQFQVQIDGQTVMEYTDPSPIPSGHIGLQHNSGRVEFRNIRLKPLSLSVIFNGQDLSGWREYPELASKFTVADGALNVQGGKGQLESEGQYANFVLQLECRTHAQDLNSGVFFRCIQGQQMNGYECQIHNGFKNGDRTAPKDCGTGGIFRRQDARAVLADDLAWFPLTLIADGPHVAAWVNGCQVSDWTDERPPHDNPRQGLRLEKGTLMLQGHDPSTNLSFRNLRIVETPPTGAP